MSGLATVCPCGHTANYHPSIEQQRVQLDATDGRFPGCCQYRPGANHHACRCITSREELTNPCMSDAIRRAYGIDQPATEPDPCPHDWSDRGQGALSWRVCWICDEVDVPATPTLSATEESEK